MGNRVRHCRDGAIAHDIAMGGRGRNCRCAAAAMAGDIACANCAAGATGAY
jgi:hypothetical protein